MLTSQSKKDVNPTTELTTEGTRQQTEPKAGRREESMTMGAEINEMEERKPTEKLNESESWFFEKINASASLELDGLRN